jgi:biotin carboxyl carrier protein
MSPAIELGECPEISERLVLSPALGVVRALAPEVVSTEGEIVREGQAIVMIESSGDSIPALSRFAGFLMGMLVEPGERVREGQPVAWLREFQWAPS